MNQLAMFDEPAPAPATEESEEGWLFSGEHTDRFYQHEAHSSVVSNLEQYRSTLVVMATGTGKTRVISRTAQHWPGNVLVLAHRDELVDQAARTIAAVTGEEVGIEQAEQRSEGQRIVVGSTQSFNKPRLDRLGKDRFGLVIADESHHYTSKTYRRAAEFFDAKILGVTATPDRGDEKALGAVFESVAYTYEILDAVEDGFLVPIEATDVRLDEVDISGVETTAGDLQAGQLDEVMLQSIEGVVQETLRQLDERQGLMFFPGVKSAQAASARMEALTCDGFCGVVSGGTPDQERKRLIADFRAGKLRVLANCMVLTEGFDAPECSLIAMARPTKSRALYAQVMGRGLRPASDLLHLFTEKHQSAERKRCIAQSRKRDCRILDFVGNAGKHSLVGPADVLGGNDPDDVVKEAKKLQKKAGGGDVMAFLSAARAAMKAQAESIKSKVTATKQRFDPFAVLGSATPSKYARRFGFRPPTPGQIERLKKFGMRPEDMKDLDSAQASQRITQLSERSRRDLATLNQLKKLHEHGVTEHDITYERASRALDYLASTMWGRSSNFNFARLRAIALERQPGED